MGPSVPGRQPRFAAFRRQHEVPATTRPLELACGNDEVLHGNAVTRQVCPVAQADGGACTGRRQLRPPRGGLPDGVMVDDRIVKGSQQGKRPVLLQGVLTVGYGGKDQEKKCQ